MIENFLHFGAKLNALSAKAEKSRCFRAYEQRDPCDRTVSHCAIALELRRDPVGCVCTECKPPVNPSPR